MISSHLGKNVFIFVFMYLCIRFFFFWGGGASFGGVGLTYPIFKFIHGFRPLYFEIAEFGHLFFILS